MEKNQTAMGMLVEVLQAMVDNGGDPDLIPAITHAKKLLVIEKDNIIKAAAHGNGMPFWFDGQTKIGEDYYYSTFKSNV